MRMAQKKRNNFIIIFTLSLIVVGLILGGLFFFNPTQQAGLGEIIGYEGIVANSFTCPTNTPANLGSKPVTSCEVQGILSCNTRTSVPTVSFRTNVFGDNYGQSNSWVAIDTDRNNRVDTAYSYLNRAVTGGCSRSSFSWLDYYPGYDGWEWGNEGIWYSSSLDRAMICVKTGSGAQAYTQYFYYSKISNPPSDYISIISVPAYADGRENQEGTQTVYSCSEDFKINNQVRETLSYQGSSEGIRRTNIYTITPTNSAQFPSIEFDAYISCNECALGQNRCAGSTTKQVCAIQNNCLIWISQTVNTPEVCTGNGQISCLDNYNGKVKCTNANDKICNSDSTGVLGCERQGTSSCYYRATTPTQQCIAPEYCRQGSCTASIYSLNASSNFRVRESIPVTVFTNIAGTPVILELTKQGESTPIDRIPIQTNTATVSATFNGLIDAGTYIIKATIQYSAPIPEAIITKEIYVNAPVIVNFQFNQIQYSNKPIIITARPEDATTTVIATTVTSIYVTPTGTSSPTPSITEFGNDIVFTFNVQGSGTLTLKAKFQRGTDISDLMSQEVQVNKPRIQIELVNLVPSTSIEEGLKTYEFRILNSQAEIEEGTFTKVQIRTPTGATELVSTTQTGDKYRFTYDYKAVQGGLYTIRIVSEKDGFTTGDSGDLTLNVVKQVTGGGGGGIIKPPTEGGTSTTKIALIVGGSIGGLALFIFILVKLLGRKKP